MCVKIKLTYRRRKPHMQKGTAVVGERISEGIDGAAQRNVRQQRADGHINRHTSSPPPSSSSFPSVVK